MMSYIRKREGVNYMATSKFTERQRSELEFYKSHGRYDNDRYKDTSLVVNTEKIENDTGIWGYAYKLLGKNGFEGKKLLDLGSGTGKHGVYFAIKGANVFAIDINSDGINLAHRRSSVNNVADKIKCCVGVAEDLPYADDRSL